MPLQVWLSYSDGQVTVDEGKISEYVKSLASKYNTAYTKRTFKTSYGPEVEVSGVYGWRIDQQAEAAALKEALAEGKNVIFDVDVVGGLNIKKYYGNQALALFIQPPSIQALEQRLKNRATDTPEVIAHRIAKAEYELSFAPKFDKIIVNDILEKAQEEAYRSIRQFLDK